MIACVRTLANFSMSAVDCRDISHLSKPEVPITATVKPSSIVEILIIFVCAKQFFWARSLKLQYQRLVQLHQLCHALALCHLSNLKSIGHRHNPIVILVGLTQLWGNGSLIVEISKVGIEVEVGGFNDGWVGLFAYRPLLIRDK